MEVLADDGIRSLAFSTRTKACDGLAEALTDDLKQGTTGGFVLGTDGAPIPRRFDNDEASFTLEVVLPEWPALIGKSVCTPVRFDAHGADEPFEVWRLPKVVRLRNP